MSTVVIRKGSSEDLAQLRLLAANLQWIRDVPFIESALDSRETVLAESEGSVVGFAIWDRSFFSRPFIWLLAVRLEHRRSGIASQLIQYVEGANKGRAMFTSTNQSNTVMQGLLAKLGYRKSGVIENLDRDDPEVFYFKQL